MVIASGLLALLTSAAFVVLLLAIRDQRNSAQSARHSQEVLAAASRVERLLVDIESGTRGYLLTGEDLFLQPAQAGEASLAQASSELVDLTRILGQNEAPGRLTAIHVSGSARSIKIKGEAYVRDYIRPLVAAAKRRDPTARLAIADGYNDAKIRIRAFVTSPLHVIINSRAAKLLTLTVRIRVIDKPRNVDLAEPRQVRDDLGVTTSAVNKDRRRFHSCKTRWQN